MVLICPNPSCSRVFPRRWNLPNCDKCFAPLPIGGVLEEGGQQGGSSRGGRGRGREGEGGTSKRKINIQAEFNRYNKKLKHMFH